jgi:hypothetical protein
VITVAALFVDARGPYPSMDGVDCWTVERDARLYPGPHPVVAHPPCGPWGNLRHLNVPNRDRLNDKDCGPIAVEHVRRFGGVLEQPAGSLLFDACGCAKPMLGPRSFTEDRFGGIALEVEQVEWGHPARKRTWLYLVGVRRPRVAPPFPGREPTHWVSGGRSRERTGSGGVVPPGIKVCAAQQRRRTPPPLRGVAGGARARLPTGVQRAVRPISGARARPRPSGRWTS